MKPERTRIRGTRDRGTRDRVTSRRGGRSLPPIRFSPSLTSLARRPCRRRRRQNQQSRLGRASASSRRLRRFSEDSSAPDQTRISNRSRAVYFDAHAADEGGFIRSKVKAGIGDVEGRREASERDRRKISFFDLIGE